MAESPLAQQERLHRKSTAKPPWHFRPRDEYVTSLRRVGCPLCRSKAPVGCLGLVYLKTAQWAPSKVSTPRWKQSNLRSIVTQRCHAVNRLPCDVSGVIAAQIWPHGEPGFQILPDLS